MVIFWYIMPHIPLRVNRLHGVTYHKIELFITTTLGNSNPNNNQPHALILNITKTFKASKIMCPQKVIPNSKMASI